MKFVIFPEQNGVPNGFLLCKGSFIGRILANLARIITSQKPSQVEKVFERPIDFVASCDKVSQKSLARLARLFTFTSAQIERK